MYSTDMTRGRPREGQVAAFIAVDRHNAEYVGVHAAHYGSSFEALDSIRKGVREHFRGFAKDVARRLSVRHDHGSQYTSRVFQDKIASLVAKSSPAFVRAPARNGCAERFIRTLKESLLWVQTYDTIEGVRQTLLAIKDTCAPCASDEPVAIQPRSIERQPPGRGAERGRP